MKPKSKLFSFALYLFIFHGIVIAGTGKFHVRKVTPGVSDTSNATTAKPGPLAYTIAFDPVSPAAQFGLIDIRSGTFHLIADLLPNSTQGIGRGPNGKIYGVDANNNLFQIDPGNGKTKIVGATGVTTPGPKGSILIDVVASLATGQLFLMDFSNNLYSVDPNTGAATLIGGTGIPTIVSPIYSSSLAGDCNSLFFTIWELDENFNTLIPPTLYRIDPSTATATVVGPTITFMAGSGFINGALYGFTVDTRLFGLTEGPHIFSIDTSTGDASLVSSPDVPGTVGAVRFGGVDAGLCKKAGP